MKLTRRLSQHLIIGSLCACLWGCNLNDIPDTENLYLPIYKGNIALVLGKDTINVKDFLEEMSENTNIQEGDNLNLSLVFEDSSDFDLGADFIQINSFTNSKFIPSPISSFYTPAQDTTIRMVRTIAFNFPASKGEKLDSTYYISGDFSLLLNSGFPADVQYTVQTASFQEIHSSQPLTIESVADYGSTVPVLDENIIDLNGFKTLLSAEADSNKFFLDVDATVLIPAGTPLSGNEYLYFELNVIDPEFDAVFGDFGQDTFNIKAQRISLDVFSDFGDSGIEFENPTITFDFQNSFGIPIGLDFTNVYAAYEDKDAFYLDGTVTDSPQDVAAVDRARFGEIVTSGITLDRNNSNIADLLSSTPDELVLDLKGYSNLNDNPENFLLESSNIKINSTIHLPLSVRLNQFEYESEFELDDMDRLEGSEEISLVFNTVNELPFDGEIDLFFINEEGVETDSLKNNVLFKSPAIFDGNGKVTLPATNTSTITLDADHIASLIASSELRLVTRLFSHGYEEDEFVTLFSDYSLIITLSVKGKVSVDLND